MLTAAELPTRARVALNAAAPVVAVMALNAVAMIVGWGANLPVFEQVAAAPPAWVTGAVWLLVYAALGVARWETGRVSERSRWVTVLLVWSVAYAFLGDAFGPTWGLVHVATLLALAAVATARVAPVSARAGGWMLGASAWIAWMTILSVLALPK